MTTASGGTGSDMEPAVEVRTGSEIECGSDPERALPSSDTSEIFSGSPVCRLLLLPPRLPPDPLVLPLPLLSVLEPSDRLLLHAKLPRLNLRLEPSITRPSMLPPPLPTTVPLQQSQFSRQISTMAPKTTGPVYGMKKVELSTSHGGLAHARSSPQYCRIRDKRNAKTTVRPIEIPTENAPMVRCAWLWAESAVLRLRLDLARVLRSLRPRPAAIAAYKRSMTMSVKCFTRFGCSMYVPLFASYVSNTHDIIEIIHMTTNEQ
mmetsp:Transcript_36572/g.84539  ORF Transcript_36572/g.84539 Transcript_36572/m.84539 type:complete len:262 (+) Transcript_36572:241-1026(+)